jgi:hypothetical protein
MVAVAIAAVVFSIPSLMERRRMALLERATAYSDKAREYGVWEFSCIIFRKRKPTTTAETSAPPSVDEKAWSKLLLDKGFYYQSLSKKYRNAAERPWLPIWPDPPEPR